jgi:hypothetical protein
VEETGRAPLTQHVKQVRQVHPACASSACLEGEAC